MPLNPETGQIIDPNTGAVKNDYKSPKIISRLLTRGERSPDIHHLKFFKKIPVFVYGIEMRGGSDNHLLDGAEYLGKAHTVTANFFMKENMHFPIAFPTSVDDGKKAKIRGEVYNVSPEHILLLDNANTNQKSFYRIKSRFVMEDQETKLVSLKDKFLEAYMYIGSNIFWEKGNIRLRGRITYTSNERLKHTQFYEWENKDFDDDPNDEWGYYGRMGFWQSSDYSHVH